MDIYKKYIKTDADEQGMVKMGKIIIAAAMLISILLTWKDLLGIGGSGGFNFIQKGTGYFSPGVFAMFILGMFWKRTTGASAIVGVLSGFALSVLFNNFAPALFGHETILYTAYPDSDGVYQIPFLICMGWSFFFTMLIMIAISLGGPKINPKSFAIDRAMFKVAPSTLALIVITLLLLAMLYVKFW